MLKHLELLQQSEVLFKLYTGSTGTLKNPKGLTYAALRKLTGLSQYSLRVAFDDYEKQNDDGTDMNKDIFESVNNMMSTSKERQREDARTNAVIDVHC